jgi:hypothetical protein
MQLQACASFSLEGHTGRVEERSELDAAKELHEVMERLDDVRKEAARASVDDQMRLRQEEANLVTRSGQLLEEITEIVKKRTGARPLY